MKQISNVIIAVLLILFVNTKLVESFEGTVGTGVCGFLDGVPKDKALIGNSYIIHESPIGDLYFFDSDNFRIMKVSQLDNIVSSIIGTGKSGYTDDNVLASHCGITWVDGIFVVENNLFYFDRIITPTSATRIVRFLGPAGIVKTIWRIDYKFSTSPSDLDKRDFKLSSDGKFLYFNHDTDIYRITILSMHVDLMYRHPQKNELLSSFLMLGSDLYYSAFTNYGGLLYKTKDMDPTLAKSITQTNSNNGYRIGTQLSFTTINTNIYCSPNNQNYNKQCIFNNLQQYGNTANFTFFLDGVPVWEGLAGQYQVLYRGNTNQGKMEFSNLNNGDLFSLSSCQIVKSSISNTLNQGCTAGCSNHGTCVGQICSCNGGWLGDAICSVYSCEQVDGCGQNGHCVGPNQCQCLEGWTGSGCTEFDCSRANNCSSHGKCIGSETCQCDPGWRGSVDCSQFSCDEIVCSNGGQCNGPNQCDCPSGYRGSRDCSQISCDQLNNCNSHGVCVSPNTCQCNSGWEKKDCSVFTCTTPCQNGGECSGPNQCKCPPGHRGSSDCSQYSCEALGNCNSHGDCIGPNQCDCEVGWLDSNCATANCLSTCNGRGNCSKPFECQCEHGWKGIECEAFSCDLLNHCNEPSNGHCDGPNHCKCKEGWKGVQCDIPSCDKNCSNVGICHSPNTCSCPMNKFGAACQYDYTCGGLAPDNPKVCDGVGKCIASDTCNKGLFIVFLVLVVGVVPIIAIIGGIVICCYKKKLKQNGYEKIKNNKKPKEETEPINVI